MAARKENYYIVKKVIPREDYTLLISFADGKTGIFDMKPYIESPMFKRLKDKELFMKAHCDGITVVWTDEIDIDPEWIHDESVEVSA